MKVEVIIAIVSFWIIFRVIMKARRKNIENLQRGGNISNNSTNTSQEIIDIATTERLAIEEADRSKEGYSLEVEVDEKSKRVLDPFMESTTLEDNSKSHYNEESLVEEFKRTHDLGKTVEHHTHTFFDAKKDRQKAIRHKGKGSKALSTSSQINRAERRTQKSHPLASAMQLKGGRKQAVMMAEIIKRPDWDRL